MAIPQAQITLTNGKLGIPPAQSDNVLAILAYCTLGTVGSVYDLSNASPQDVVSLLGYGRGPQLAAAILGTENHGAIVFVPLTASNVGANTSVTAAGTSPPTVTITGTPVDGGIFKMRIVTAGARGTFTFQWSPDNGATWSGEIVSAATFAVPNFGITINIANTAASADNTWTWTSTAPWHSTSDVGTGYDTLLASGRDIGGVVVLSQQGGTLDTDRSAAMATLFGTISTKTAAFHAAYKPIFSLMEAPIPVANDATGLTAWRAALNGSGAALSDKFILVATGMGIKASAVDGFAYRRSAMFAVAPRVSAAPISEDLGRVLSGALTGWTSIEHDEEATGGLGGGSASQRYTTLRTIAGRTGFYITEGRMFESPGGDYELIQAVRVINTATKVERNILLNHLNDSVIVDESTGKIREDEAQAIDRELTTGLEDALVHTIPQHASSVAGRVSRNDDILATKTLSGECAVQPLGYTKSLVFTNGFTKANKSASL